MRRTAAAALLLSVAVPASAQLREQPVAELAADLAYGLCPLYLGGQLSLTGPELEQRGFAKAVTKRPHPRVGEMSLVSAKLADGNVAFGGAAGKACTVVVDAPDRPAVLARLHANMAFMGLDFQTEAVPPESADLVPGGTVEAYRAPVQDQFLHLQLIQVGGASASGAVVAQLYVTDK